MGDMDDLEDLAWIVWCALLSALLFYILVQTVRYCAKVAKSRGMLNPDANPTTNATEDFTSVSPVYTISRTLPSIDTLTTNASNRELTVSSRNSSLNIDTEKSDGLPSYEEAIQIMMTPTAPMSAPFETPCDEQRQSSNIRNNSDQKLN